MHRDDALGGGINVQPEGPDGSDEMAEGHRRGGRVVDEPEAHLSTAERDVGDEAAGEVGAVGEAGVIKAQRPGGAPG